MNCNGQREALLDKEKAPTFRFKIRQGRSEGLARTQLFHPWGCEPEAGWSGSGVPCRTLLDLECSIVRLTRYGTSLALHGVARCRHSPTWSQVVRPARAVLVAIEVMVCPVEVMVWPTGGRCLGRRGTRSPWNQDRGTGIPWNRVCTSFQEGRKSKRLQ